MNKLAVIFEFDRLIAKLPLLNVIKILKKKIASVYFTFTYLHAK